MKKLLFFLIITFFIVLFSKPVLGISSFELDQKEYLIQTSSVKEFAETAVIKNTTTKPLGLSLAWTRDKNVPTRFADFATLSSSKISLEPFAISTTEIKFVTPEDLKPGDYYASLVVSTASGDEIQRANFTIRYLGELKEEISQNSLDYRDGKLFLTLENKGNKTTKVRMHVKVTNIFGEQILSKDIDQFDLKASEIRTNSFVTNITFPGLYKVQTEMVFGEKEAIQTSLNSIWVKKSLLLVVIALLTLTIFVLGLSFLLRRNVQKTS